MCLQNCMGGAASSPGTEKWRPEAKAQGGYGGIPKVGTLDGALMWHTTHAAEAAEEALFLF